MSMIDRQQLSEQLEGDMDLLQEATDIFVEESRTMHSGLREAVAGADREKVHSLVHSLNGMFSNFFADAPCRTLVKIEDSMGSDAATAKQLVEELGRQIDLMIAELKQLLDSGKL